MEFAVCLFIGLLHAHDTFNALVQHQIVSVQIGGVAHQTENGAAYAVGNADPQPLDLQLMRQSVNSFLGGAGLHNNDHC